jgi:hypothetical protein
MDSVALFCCAYQCDGGQAGNQLTDIMRAISLLLRPYTPRNASLEAAPSWANMATSMSRRACKHVLERQTLVTRPRTSQKACHVLRTISQHSRIAAASER